MLDIFGRLTVLDVREELQLSLQTAGREDR